MLAKCLFRPRDTPAPSATCTSNRGGIHRVSFNLGETFPYPSWAGKWPLLLRAPKRDMAPTNEHPLRRKNLAWRIGCWSYIRRPTRVRAQARQTLALENWDDANGLIKINPLLEWTSDDVWAYIKIHDVPYNALHHRGYPSIGCAPCTRAVQSGEDSRSGRWWWESSTKECGLHVAAGFSPRSK